MSAENLGEFLTGDRIDNSPYQLYMRDDSYCNLLCQQKYNKKDVDVFKKAIAEEYHHNWIIDNLPAASVIDTEEYITTSYSRGFPVGYTDATKGHYLYNHVNIIIKYHELSPDENRVVGFYVEPFSVKHSVCRYVLLLCLADQIAFREAYFYFASSQTFSSLFVVHERRNMEWGL